MRSTGAVAGCAVVAMVLASVSGGAGGRANVVIRRIAIVDAAAGRLLPDRDIVVRGSRIEWVGAAAGTATPAKTTVRGQGKYVIAGLIDAGVDARAFVPTTGQALLAWGITGIGDIGGDQGFSARWRRDIDSGRRYAPRLASACGDLAAGSSASSKPASPDAVHEALARLVAAGKTPSQALLAFTASNAAALCLDGVGTIAAGQSADLVVLTANPLDDVRHTREIDAVVFRGEVLTQAHVRMLRRGTLPTPVPLAP